MMFFREGLIHSRHRWEFHNPKKLWGNVPPKIWPNIWPIICQGTIGCTPNSVPMVLIGLIVRDFPWRGTLGFRVHPCLSPEFGRWISTKNRLVGRKKKQQVTPMLEGNSSMFSPGRVLGLGSLMRIFWRFAIIWSINQSTKGEDIMDVVFCSLDQIILGFDQKRSWTLKYFHVGVVFPGVSSST